MNDKTEIIVIVDNKSKNTLLKQILLRLFCSERMGITIRFLRSFYPSTFSDK